MAFDAGMLACMIHEIGTVALGGRVEKIMQPARDEIVLQMRTTQGGKRLLIQAGCNNPRIGFTDAARENPMQAPMFCMLLRKHLTGAKLASLHQEGFERVVTLGFDTRDEMGFACRKYLIAEIMGKYSNLIFTDENKKILSALRIVDFTTSALRQVLPGMTYELPPAQDKEDPITVTPERFAELYAGYPREKSADKFISGSFRGIATSVAREIVFLATRHTDTPAEYVRTDALFDAFSGVMARIRENRYEPTLVLDGTKPIEYAYLPLTQYTGMELRRCESASAMLDTFFAGRDREAGLHQRAQDLLHLLSAAESRIRKKTEAQRAELAECEMGEQYRRYGDLITANLHAIARGSDAAELTDYADYREDGSYGTVLVPLDKRATPNENAQRYYKKYAKSKTAKTELTRQLERNQSELEYLYSVFDALSKAETTADLTEIRDELYRSGYASRMKGYSVSRKSPTPVPAKFRTRNGYTVLCGKNNVQNEYLTHRLADRNDWWFHAKNVPGSHVVLQCHGEEDPPAEDFTDAAEIAAYFSGARDGTGVPVDYLRVRGVRKVAGARPGFVIYHTNWTAYVTPSEEKINRMRQK